MARSFSIDVILDETITVRGSHSEARMILFHGSCDSDFFKGKILPGGVDTQKCEDGQACFLSARYIMQGTDSNGDRCSVFIENNGIIQSDGSICTIPKFTTDSPSLAWLETTDFSGRIEGVPGGVKIIFEETKRKTIHVAAAVIKSFKGGETKILATQRGCGDWKDWWEFPGGKIEAGESAEQTVVREIKEELESAIRVEGSLGTVDYDYPAFHLRMDCFIASVESGTLELKEHEDAKWLSKEELRNVKWLPADLEVVERIERSNLF